MIKRKPFSASLAIAVGALLASFVVACGDGDTTVVQTGGPVTGISATGTGEAVGDPDLAIIQLGVDVERDTVAEARADAAEAMDAVLASLRASGVADNDLQTVQFSIQPQFDFSNDRQTLRGFRVSNVVTAKIRDIDSAGQVIDDAATAGADSVVIQGISFTIEDPTELQAEARKQAVAEAREQAEQLASEAGVGLGKILTISEGFGQVVPQFFDGRSFAADEATQILGGELTVSVTVQVVYAID